MDSFHLTKNILFSFVWVFKNLYKDFNARFQVPSLVIDGKTCLGIEP